MVEVLISVAGPQPVESRQTVQAYRTSYTVATVVQCVHGLRALNAQQLVPTLVHWTHWELKFLGRMRWRCGEGWADGWLTRDESLMQVKLRWSQT